jgi:hypothetical protein
MSRPQIGGRKQSKGKYLMDRIQYLNMAGEQRTFETREPRPKRTRTSRKRKLVCYCGHEICLGCVKATWRTRIAGECVRCCNCDCDNPLLSVKLHHAIDNGNGRAEPIQNGLPF